MDISLKQPEIVKALSLYLSSQGINTRDKVVTADFAMGRGENGLTVVIKTEETPIPGYSTADVPAINADLTTGTSAKKTKVIGSGSLGAKTATPAEENAAQAVADTSTTTGTAAGVATEDTSNVETVNAEDVGATNANPFGGDVVNDTPVSDTEAAPAAAAKTASIFG